MLPGRVGRTITTHVLTSAYSVFGNDGQHDYCAANETMDRICGLAGVGGKDRWASIAWLAWDGIGMTRGSEYRVLAEQRSLSGVSPRVGQRLFRDVLAGQTGSAINVPISDAELIEYEIKTVPPAKNDAIKTGRVIEISVALSEIECLPFHKIRNTPTLPGAWILDRLVNAALQLCPDTDRIKEVTVQDVLFTRFVRFAKGQEPNVRVVAEETDHSIVAWMIADVLHPTGRVLSKDVICAKAILSFGRQPGQLRSSVDGLHGVNGHGADRFVSDPYCQGTHREIDLSGPFDCLGDIKIGAGGRRAKFAPDGNCTWSSDLPALLLDAAWRVGAMYATSGNDQLFVPVQIGRMVIPVGEDVNCTSASGWEIRSTHPKPEGRDVYWDRTEVIDQDGMLRLVVENSFAKRIA